jgi:hypothetical protein
MWVEVLNYVKLKTSEKKILDQILGEVRKRAKPKDLLDNDGGWFNLIKPLPIPEPTREETEDAESEQEGYQVPSWFDSWGTASEGWNQEGERVGDTLTITFATSDDPPLPVYEELLRRGWSVEGVFQEHGHPPNKIGEYQNGAYEEFWWNIDAENPLEGIPQHLIEKLNLQDQVEQHLEWKRDNPDDYIAWKAMLGDDFADY